MKIKLSIKVWLAAVGVAAGLMTACSDEWDKHYQPSLDVKGNQSLNELIAADASLSTFYTMLQQTGYDTIIGTSQTYTVWAPNNDALSGVDLNNTALVKSIVMNHIARFSYPTSGISDKNVYMQTGKYIAFSDAGAGQYAFGGIALVSSNKTAKNGILHSISQYIPTHLNLWQYIMETPGLDSLRAYLLSKDSRVFDPLHSEKIGVINVNGKDMPIYDSVFIDANSVLKYIGDIKSEDSVYTMIMPTNTAWSEAYNRIGAYYKMAPTTAYNYLKRQREKTQFGIIRDLVFRGRLDQSNLGDSLVSTYGHAFYNPSYLFAGSFTEFKSNGISHTTDQLTHLATESWHRTIKVEAENDSLRVTANATVYKLGTEGTWVTTSGNKYLWVDPFPELSSLSKISATFPIRNTLAAKYNIYCVFVPDSLANPFEAKPTKVNFYLSYITATGGKRTNQKLTVANNVVSQNAITKMFVASFTFPVATMVDQYTTSVDVALKVENAVATNETAQYTRSMRIDYILLEPAQ